MRYRAEIDGLRAVAVIAVMLYHAHVPGFAGGFVGVDVFFVISGYLIAGLLRAEAERGQVDLLAFWGRRARRLLPLLLLVSLTSLAAAWLVLLPEELKDFGQGLVLAPVFATNLLYWHEAGYFAAGAGAKPLLHLWSLGVEGQFYLLFPLVLLPALRRGLAFPALVLLGVASFCGSLWASRAWPEAAFFLLPFRLWEFTIGAALACRRGAPLPGLAGLAGLGAILWAVLRFDGGMAFPGWAALVPAGGAALVLASGGASRRWLSAAPLVWLGVLSYALYLWHYPAFALLEAAGVGLPRALPVLVPLLLGLSWASHRLVERPFRQVRAARGIGAMGFGAVAAVVAGVALHLTGGAPGRLPASALAVAAATERGPMPCHDAPLRAEGFCVVGARGVSPSIVLIGDSHAGHLSASLGQALEARGQAAAVLTCSWCAPVPGFGTRAPTRGPGCGAYMEAAWAKVVAAPGLRTVIMAAQWGNFTDGARAGLAPVTYGAALRPEDNVAAFAAALAGFAPKLAATGRRVVIVEPVPEYDRPVPQKLMRAAWGGAQVPGHATPVDHAARNGAALVALSTFARVAGAERLAVRPLFCSAAGCAVTDRDGIPLYRDASHLSQAGAARVVEAVLDMLDGPAPGTTVGTALLDAAHWPDRR